MFDQLPHTTSRIEAFFPSGQTSIGTGFFFSFEIPEGNVVTLVTNKHVVMGATSAKIYVSRSDGDQALFGQFNSWDIEDFNQTVVSHPDPNVDLAAFPVGGIFQEMESAGTPAYYRSFVAKNIPNQIEIKALTAIENILMIGYPTGIWDQANNLPIIRRGITATPYKRNYNGREEFMIDCACYPGSSGSPIIIADNVHLNNNDGSLTFSSRFHLLGLLWGGPLYSAEGQIIVRPAPTSVMPISVSQIPTNLGFCIKSSKILDLLPLIIKRFSK